jgi:hypothetical protein
MSDRKISALTALTSPAAGDYVPIVDISESADADKNKRITYEVLNRSLPNGTASAPSTGWLTDSGTTGLYRPEAEAIGITCNTNFIGKFTANGLKLGGAAGDSVSAQLHLSSSDTTDQILFTNTDAGVDNAPDLVLFRDSSSPANNDNLGAIFFRGNDSAGNAAEYAQITSLISSSTNGAEQGVLRLSAIHAGTSTPRVVIVGPNVGISESSPDYPLHITDTLGATTLQMECAVDDAGGGGDISFYRHRAAAASQVNDVIGNLLFQAHNAASTPARHDFAQISALVDAVTDGAEEGQLRFQVSDAGTLTTRLTLKGAALTLSDAVDIAVNTSTGTKIGTATGQKIGFWNTTPVDQPAAIADLTVSASSGTLPTANGSITVSNAASPTVAELLEFCVELEKKVEDTLARLRETGLIAT